MVKRILALGTLFAATFTCLSGPVFGQDADLIVINGQIVTADEDDSIHQAMAVREGRILSLGSNEEVLDARAASTRVVDLQGRTVLPGLIDSHTHPGGAAMTEFDHEIPQMETVQDVLSYIHSRTQKVPEGEWIRVRQVFITRLKEQRYPTRDELDRVAPGHPVIFSTGPDASLNSLALKRSGINRQTQNGELGKIERDPATGEPTGILRNYDQYVKLPPSQQASQEDHYSRLHKLLSDYAATGLTSICDRAASYSTQKHFEKLLRNGELPVRVSLSRGINTDQELDKVLQDIREIADDPLVHGGPMLKIIGVKAFLDGGMLTGSALMRKPWGVSEIYSIDDPKYRGVQLVSTEKLLPIIRATVKSGLQFTAHSVGDGAVHTLLETYEKINREMPIKETRPSITHSNFMSKEAIDMMDELGVVADIQPAWLYLDTRTLNAQFSYERLRYFQPLRTIFKEEVIAGGGSDHMQKVGSMRSVNPYNPFLGMWVAVTRKAKGYQGQLHPEEALTRMQAIRFYTINNAYILFQEDVTGSLEPGKLADFIVIDRDILNCPEDEIPQIQVLSTYLEGKEIYSAGP